jgi:hypothetical protein
MDPPPVGTCLGAVPVGVSAREVAFRLREAVVGLDTVNQRQPADRGSADRCRAARGGPSCWCVGSARRSCGRSSRSADAGAAQPWRATGRHGPAGWSKAFYAHGPFRAQQLYPDDCHDMLNVLRQRTQESVNPCREVLQQMLRAGPQSGGIPDRPALSSACRDPRPTPAGSAAISGPGRCPRGGSPRDGAQDLVPLLQEGATGNLVVHEHDIDG